MKNIKIAKQIAKIIQLSKKYFASRTDGETILRTI